MTPLFPRMVFAMIVAIGAGCASSTLALAQATNLAPYDAGEQVDEDLSRLDMQNVMPARQQLLAAIQQLRADAQTGGTEQTIFNDQLAVIEARQAVIDAQVLADQTRMPQAPADVQGMLQARDEVLRAEQALGEAQKKLIGDRQANNTGAFREDIALVNSARVQTRQAHQLWAQTRAQIHNELSPSGIQ